MNSKTIEPVTGIRFDVAQINQDIDKLLEDLSFDVHDDCFRDQNITKLGINLTHPPMTTQIAEFLNDKWPGNTDSAKYVGALTFGDKPAVQAGINPASYNIIGHRITETYLGSVIEQVKQYHALAYPELNPVTRVYCAYLNTFGGYRMHLDTHTVFKYHLPLIENKYSFMFAEDEAGLEMVHLPADGRLWKLDTRKLHSAVNLAPLSNNYRMHIIFSVYDNPFNIYESDVYQKT